MHDDDDDVPLVLHFSDVEIALIDKLRGATPRDEFCLALLERAILRLKEEGVLPEIH
jgi:hypothetical protein